MKFISSVFILMFFLPIINSQSLVLAQYEIPYSVFSSGGKVLSNGSYQIYGSLGQHNIGITKNSFKVKKLDFR